MKTQIKTIVFIIVSSLIATLFSGCGKNEGTAGTIGAASGALIGNAVAGKRNKATGTLVGALVGNVFGREVGKAADKEEEQIKQSIRSQRAKRIFTELQEENHILRENLKKWCFTCRKKIHILGAQTCPSCGDELGTKKFCGLCKESFMPDSEYRYCPFCKDKVKLSYR